MGGIQPVLGTVRTYHPTAEACEGGGVEASKPTKISMNFIIN